jgi:hypothetical protein
MLVAQALGEYGVMSSLMEGIRSGGDYLQELWRDFGVTGSLILVATLVVWKILTRVK